AARATARRVRKRGWGRFRAGILAFALTLATASAHPVSISTSASAQDASAGRAAVERLAALYDVLDPNSAESTAAYLDAVKAGRAVTPDAADPNRAYVELYHARGLGMFGRDAEAEAVLRAAIESTSGDSEARAKLYLDLAEYCSARRE